MELVGMMHDLTTWGASVTHWADLLQSNLLQSDFLHSIQTLPLELAQIKNKVPETDLWGDLTKAFNNFVKTGQAWAFLVGLVIGYLVRTFTSFG